MPELRVVVPKSTHGKVIGKSRATQLDIESDYSVTLTFPDRDAPENSPIIVTGPTQVAVEAAQARILDIAGLGRDEVAKLREPAKELWEAQSKLFEIAHNLPKGTKDRSDAFDRANQAKAKAEKAELEAGEAIFALKNKGYGDDQMDLHGLTVAEAERFVRKRLTKVEPSLKSGQLDKLTIITGAGNHSVNGPKIRPKIIDMLRESGFPFTEDEGLAQLFVYAKSKSGEVPKAPAGAKVVQPKTPLESFFDAVGSFILNLCGFKRQ